MSDRDQLAVPAGTDRAELLARFAASAGADEYAKARAKRREQVARAAINGGRDPRREYTREALLEILTSDELELLIEAAEDRRLERLTTLEAVDRRERVDSMVRQIRRERAEAERREIEAEARRRLGLDRHGLPIESDNGAG